MLSAGVGGAGAAGDVQELLVLQRGPVLLHGTDLRPRLPPPTLHLVSASQRTRPNFYE